ncbi:MAG: hypothetical protein D6795_12840, partial [Deltaproteobacteria bacterium]
MPRIVSLPLLFPYHCHDPLVKPRFPCLPDPEDRIKSVSPSQVVCPAIVPAEKFLDNVGIFGYAGLHSLGISSFSEEEVKVTFPPGHRVFPLLHVAPLRFVGEAVRPLTIDPLRVGHFLRGGIKHV